MAYGGQSTYGLNPQQANARNRITQALMRIADPPPGGMLAPGTPPVSPQGPVQPPQPPQPVPGMGMGMPQQPAALGTAAAPVGAMGAVGGPYQQGMNLPGVQPPGQLPQGMRPGGY
jgi:hypothetical protein